jgi:glyoxylase-like metal-dependent hydrolase (beta-lactamase superfamily II)
MKTLQKTQLKSVIRSIKYGTTCLMAIFIFNINSNAQAKDSLIKVTKGVYQITGFVGNISFLENESGVILFDAGVSPNAGKRALELIQSVTNKPLKYAIITHYHYDHVGGLSALPQNIPIIGQKNDIANIKNDEDNHNKTRNITLPHEIDSLKALLLQFKSNNTEQDKKADSTLTAKETKLEEMKQQKFVYPNELVDSLKTIIMGSDTIEIIFPGKTHTNGDLVINIKSKQTMVLGDLLFTHAYPYMDPLGDVNNWAKQLKLYASSNTKYFIPGHMYVASAKDVKEFANYLTDLRIEVAKLKNEGKSIEDIKKALKIPAYSNFQFGFFREQNMETLYNQLK